MFLSPGDFLKISHLVRTDLSCPLFSSAPVSFLSLDPVLQLGDEGLSSENMRAVQGGCGDAKEVYFTTDP